MPLVSLQERLRAISDGLGAVIPNDGFRVLAADDTENGLSIGSEEGQRALDPLLSGVDLVIFDNLSTLCTNGSESASDAWVPMQNWLIKLRRQGIAVLLVHHAGTNGRQRGTSRREDALDTVIALRRPDDYSPEQGARFEVHFEKLRNRVDGDGAIPFEAKLEAISADETTGFRVDRLRLTSARAEASRAAFQRWTFGPGGRLDAERATRHVRSSTKASGERRGEAVAAERCSSTRGFRGGRDNCPAVYPLISIARSAADWHNMSLNRPFEV